MNWALSWIFCWLGEAAYKAGRFTRLDHHFEFPHRTYSWLMTRSYIFQERGGSGPWQLPLPPD